MVLFVKRLFSWMHTLVQPVQEIIFIKRGISLTNVVFVMTPTYITCAVFMTPTSARSPLCPILYNWFSIIFLTAWTCPHPLLWCTFCGLLWIYICSFLVKAFSFFQQHYLQTAFCVVNCLKFQLFDFLLIACWLQIQ